MGITRAMHKLYLLRAFKRGFRGKTEPTLPSRFLRDIPKKLIKSEKTHVITKTPSSARNNRQAITSTMPTPNPSVKSHVTNVRTGDKVRHDKFGEGMVISCKPNGSDFEIKIAFKDGQGVKRLLLSFARLEKIG